MSATEPDYSAKVTRQYNKENKDVKQNITEINGTTIVNDEKFDEVLSEAFKLYEGEIFTGPPIDIQYMSKDAFLDYTEANGSYKKFKSSTSKMLDNQYTKRVKLSDKSDQNFLNAGIALVANRAMDCSRMFSYPRTYLINLNLAINPDIEIEVNPRPNIRDYQRLILVKTEWDTDSQSHYNQIVIIDLAPYSIKGSDLKKIAIPCNVYQFDFLSLNYYYTYPTTFLGVQNIANAQYKYVDPSKIITTDFLKSYFSEESDNGFELKIIKNQTFKLTDILSNSSLAALPTSNQVYIHPLQELHLATLYIVDYYSRNRESPAYQFRAIDKTHNVLLYICNNMQKIKTVYDAAIHLGFLITQLPVDEQQNLMFVMNTRLDVEKFKAIDQMIIKQEEERKSKSDLFAVPKIS